MPFKTFTASVLSSADVNTYLMKQAVITCTSGTRPVSPVEGMLIYETDTDLLQTYNGTAWESMGGWQSYTPTLTGITLNNGTVTGRWSRVGKEITFFATVTFGSGTTVTAGVSIGLPVNSTGSAMGLCTAVYFDTSATQRIPGTGLIFTSTATTYVVAGGNVSAAVPFTWTTGDQIFVGGTYEAA